MQEDLQTRIDNTKQEISLILKKYNIKLGVNINFPQYRIIPEEALLAVKILNNLKAESTIMYEDAGGKGK